MEIEEPEARLEIVEKNIQKVKNILAVLASKRYEIATGKTKEQIQKEIAETTELFKFHLKSKHFLKGESFDEPIKP